MMVEKGKSLTTNDTIITSDNLISQGLICNTIIVIPEDAITDASLSTKAEETYSNGDSLLSLTKM